MDSHSDPTENLDASLLDGMEDLFYLIIIYLFIYIPFRFFAIPISQ